jgi:hypothetical protein
MMPPGWPSRFPELPIFEELRALDVAGVARAILPTIKQLEARTNHGITPKDTVRAIAEDRYRDFGDEALLTIMSAVNYLQQIGVLVSNPKVTIGEVYKVMPDADALLEGASSFTERDPKREALARASITGVDEGKPLIFISHIHEERNLALVLKDMIEEAYPGKFSIFVASHFASIGSGDKWLDEIIAALRACSLEIILCSPRSLTRSWIHFEGGAGWIRDIPVIPLCHSGINPEDLPMPLTMLQAALATDKESVVGIFSRLSKLADVPSEYVDLDAFVSYAEAFVAEFEVEPVGSNTEAVSPYSAELDADDEFFFNSLPYPEQIGRLRLRVYPRTYNANRIPRNNFAAMAEKIVASVDGHSMPYATERAGYATYRWGVERINNGVGHPAFRDGERLNASGLLSYRRPLVEDFEIERGYARQDGNRYVSEPHLRREIKLLFELAAIAAQTITPELDEVWTVAVMFVGNYGRYMIANDGSPIPQSPLTPPIDPALQCREPEFSFTTTTSVRELNDKRADFANEFMADITFFFKIVQP